MKCFYHPEKDAVGICKNCQKGLCMECAADVDNGLACKNRCEDTVKSMVKYARFARMSYQENVTRNSWLGSLWYIVIGLAFLAVTILDGGKSPVGWIVGIAGVFFLFFAASSYRYAQNIKGYIAEIDKEARK